jgi:KDO2-lipid IV(A) lauroyltransferase
VSLNDDEADMRPAGIGTRAVWVVLRAIQSAVAALPLRAALWVGRRLGEAAYFVVYPRTRVALEQMAWAMPELSRSRRRATIRDMYRPFGQSAVEFFRLPRMAARGELDRIVTVEGEHIVRDAFAQGKGLLILTAHYGNFELLATFFAARGYQVNLVTRKLRNGVLDRFWASSVGGSRFARFSKTSRSKR